MFEQLDPGDMKTILRKFLAMQWAPDYLLVHEPHKHRRILALTIAPFIIGMTAVVAMSADEYSWYRIAAGPVFGLLIAWASLSAKARFHAYRNGWLEGRAMMMVALDEALRRGLTVTEWAQSQAEQDAVLNGGTPTIIIKNRDTDA